jgi:raffinose/stachyose/melibiose transport system permease protein
MAAKPSLLSSSGANMDVVLKPRKSLGKLVNVNFAAKDRLAWFLYTIPALVIYVTFLAVPLFNSIRFSLYSGQGIVPDEFVGLGNFERIIKDPYWNYHLVNALRNTCIFFLIHMGVQNTLGMLFAVLLNMKIKAASIFRTIIFFPATMSVLVIGFLWALILNPRWGMFNQVLELVGLGEFARPWLGDPKFALIVISLVSCWQWVGLPTMMYLAALIGIPEELVDAAKVDGASGWQIFWKIKIPLITPIIGIVSVLTFIGNFSAFDIVFAMASSRGDPQYSTDIMGSFFYRMGIAGELFTGHMDAGMGAAIATIIFLILLTGILIWLFFTRKQERYEL